MAALRNLLQWKTIAKEALDRTLIVTKFLCILHVTDKYLCSSFHVHGPSMYPTMNLKGDVLLVEKFSTRLGKLVPGDIVMLKAPDNPTRTVTKRLLGMEGDQVTFLTDPHIESSTKTLLVPKGHVWVQGDNLYDSKDSRYFGPVPYGLLEGKVFYRIWPLIDFGSLNQGLWK
ncbi:hypothetical protein AQUCO_02200142v1 [Aquilegia coerulea]|uniref:Peptidase S26 domain-containing protein n=1 Tax=Aquilegia coerulea TaxID=218851 RepID=A0A2G5DDA6_AQUCA|nr:hypothetical protein AQUCO_02200142v1 [Aquilegia coerulea]PIA41511.1 hypothetical protein AQUCO_02200142v1 [Aquilegia coerulea]PIA41512.1 hypothetical protein AQUCO_02200142v1 [Aquilegia coerulea]PIA41513.1 hypothetical protein AQUCO_02200142v1 [Aquilegia coerulea]PIA41514.1 hypothetical protein AQUCO_02200142v1 [Aquilegia coerulea]